MDGLCGVARVAAEDSLNPGPTWLLFRLVFVRGKKTGRSRECGTARRRARGKAEAVVGLSAVALVAKAGAVEPVSAVEQWRAARLKQRASQRHATPAREGEKAKALSSLILVRGRV